MSFKDEVRYTHYKRKDPGRATLEDAIRTLLNEGFPLPHILDELRIWTEARYRAVGGDADKMDLSLTVIHLLQLRRALQDLERQDSHDGYGPYAVDASRIGE